LTRRSASYTPTAIEGGDVLLGTHDGDDGHGRATAQFTLDVTLSTTSSPTLATQAAAVRLRGCHA